MTAPVTQTDATSVRLTRDFNTTVEHLFDCFTTPALLTRWWGPAGTTCPNAESDLTVGGRYRFEILGTESGNLTAALGEYLEIHRPHRLVFSWGWEHEPDEITQVTLNFRALEGGRSRIELVHERFPTAERAGAHKDGWSSSLDCLERVVDEAIHIEG